MRTQDAYELAWFIEETHAKERARIKRQFDKWAAHREFDPLAATCLAELILAKSAPRTRRALPPTPMEPTK